MGTDPGVLKGCSYGVLAKNKGWAGEEGRVYGLYSGGKEWTKSTAPLTQTEIMHF